MTIARVKIFGQVLCIIGYEDEDETDAIRIANNTPHGLSGYVPSGDIENARRQHPSERCWGRSGITLWRLQAVNIHRAWQTTRFLTAGTSAITLTAISLGVLPPM